MLIRANALQIPLKDNSVQCVVTSPPYWGLRDYGTDGQLGLESTPEAYVANMVAVFSEVWRVLRDDGTVWVNLGDSYARQAGDDSTNVTDGNLKTGRTGKGSQLFKSGNNLPPPGLKPKDLVGIPWRVAFALQAAGWYLRSDIIWAKPNPMPESVTDRPTKSHEYIFLLSKRERYYFDQDAVREPLAYPELTLRSTVNGQGNGELAKSARFGIGDGAGRNIRSVWTIATQPYPEAHFATFPESLIKPCILAGCPVGGIVLDPFSGSGTTVKVAQDLGRIGVGLDLKPDYLAMARKRSAQMGLMI